jgi:hypothetical protein
MSELCTSPGTQNEQQILETVSFTPSGENVGRHILGWVRVTDPVSEMLCFVRNTGQWIKPKNSVLPSVIYHIRSPSKLTQLSVLYKKNTGTRWRSWLRHYATNRKVAGSIPDEVTGFFNWPNPSTCAVALGPTQPLTEMSTRNIPGGKERPARKTDKLTAICVSIF